MLRALKNALRDSTGTAFRQRMWNRIVDAPILSHLYYRLDPDISPLRLRRNTDLLIDGFPRSVNTYVTEAILLANPGLSLSHHLHQPRVVERAVARTLPTILLIREPDATVASFAAFAPQTALEEIYHSYTYYYERLIPLVPHVVVADFTEATTNLGRVLAAVQERYGLALQPPEHADETEIFRRIDTFSNHYFGNENFGAKVSRPSPHRTHSIAHSSGVGNQASDEIRKQAWTAYEDVLRARRDLPMN